MGVLTHSCTETAGYVKSVNVAEKYGEKRKVYAVRRYNGSFCTQKQPNVLDYQEIKLGVPCLLSAL